MKTILVRMTPDVLEQLWVRNEFGYRVTCEIGEPVEIALIGDGVLRAVGVYNPTWTVHRDQPLPPAHLSEDQLATIESVRAHYETGFGDLDHAADDVAMLLDIVGSVPPPPTPDQVDDVLADVSATGYASEACQVVEDWIEARYGVVGKFTAELRAERAAKAAS